MGRDVFIVRGMLALVSILAAMTIALITVITINDRRDNESPTATALAAATATQAIATPAGTDATATTALTPADPGATATTVATQPPLPNVELLTVNPPEMASLIGPLGLVREYYSETYSFGDITVGWRPGAFPPERAEEVAAVARRAIDQVNAVLGTSDTEPLEVFLADQLFDDGCVGCQGFAASDLRQVFVLQDGSVAPEEFETLLTHEIGHVIAGNHVALPDGRLFWAEGFAVWVTDANMEAAGIIPSIQTAAWAWKAGELPSLEQLREASLSGRVRARLEYDGASAFTRFIVETYGMDAYRELYTSDSPEAVLDKNWETLEAEWQQFLAGWADRTANGVGYEQWVAANEQVMAGFRRLYDDPASVSAVQYSQLATARVLLNRGEVAPAIALADASDLITGAAN